MKADLKSVHDSQLIGLIHSGNREAFGELYHRYYKKVYHRCLSFAKDPDEAFDLAQEALMKAFDKLHTFRGDASFSTWLYTITTRHCLAGWKKEHRKKGVTLPAVAEQHHYDLPEEDGVADRAEQETIMFRLLHALPEPELQLLTLKYKDGVSIEKLQATLDLSSSAIKMRLKRSKEKLNVLYSLALTYGLEQVLTLL
jgi:RNA polymerase sigma-70 factor (ECF subfamily)